MKDTSPQIVVEVSLALVCGALAIGLWGTLFAAITWPITVKGPYLWAAAILLLINTGHYTWGVFYVDDDFSDISNDGLMMSWFDFHRLIWRIVGLLTIGPSVHLRRAVALWRSRSEEQD